MRDEVVLVGVLKDRRDLAILLRERWYRVPKQYMPRRAFAYLAFYQPEAFGRHGKCIRYYARALNQKVVPRLQLLPHESTHPRAQAPYIWLRVGPVKTLPVPIKNTAPRRVVFGFTTLGKLLTARNMLQLYDIAPTEYLMKRALVSAGIQAQPQQWVSIKGKRYRLDFAIQCKRGKVAIECDNKKAHSGATQFQKDQAKDANLKRNGWQVIRLTERAILSDLVNCVARVKRVIELRGGQVLP
ncbi:MAG: DUF559 domain-containing protein [bacterium]|nr:DUF559 domain-containing protein [bacterium]